MCASMRGPSKKLKTQIKTLKKQELSLESKTKDKTPKEQELEKKISKLTGKPYKGKR